MAKKEKEVKAEVKTEAEVKEAKPEIKEEASTGTPHYKSRLAALNEIAQGNREAREEALIENDPEVLEDVKAANAAAEAEAENPATPETPAIEEEKPKRKFIVNGKEVFLTEEEIIERVQKSEAVDQRMREATALLEDAKRRSLPTQQPVPSPLPVPPDAGKADELVSNLTAAIVRGSEEEISKALKDTIGGGRLANQLTTQAQGLDPRQVQGLVIETIAFNQAKQLLDEPPERGGFSDIFADPVLKSQFERRESELRDAGDQRPYRELYTAIGTELRTWRDQFVAKHAPKSGLEDRDSLKRQAGVVRGAGSRLPSPQVVAPKSHEEKLEQMRRSRGLN